MSEAGCEEESDEDVIVEEDLSEAEDQFSILESNTNALTDLLGARIEDAKQVETEVIHNFEAQVARSSGSRASSSQSTIYYPPSDASQSVTQEVVARSSGSRASGSQSTICYPPSDASQSATQDVGSESWSTQRLDAAEQVEATPTKAELALAAAAKAVKSLSSKSKRPLLPVGPNKAPASVLSDKDYLTRFRRKVPARASIEMNYPTTGGSSSSTAPAPTTKDSIPDNVALPVKEEPASPKHRRRRTGESIVQAVEDDEESAEGTEGARPSSGPYIDVNQLVPKAARDICRWQDANPGEMEAMIAQGEQVSAKMNLLRIAKIKRKKTAIEDENDKAKKVRRDDDTNDVSFQRRQALWMNTARSADSALRPKQQVDEAGKVKTDNVDALKQETSEAKSRGCRLQDDVRVDEGLRCPRWLWEALYPYQHECVKWLWGLHCQKMGGILADEMGLGKTVQIAAYLAAIHHSGVLQKMRVQNASLGAASHARSGGILLICPATLISQWKKELHLWYPPLRICTMHQVDDRERKETIKKATREQGLVITSYETMRIASEDLIDAPWVLLILDEGQKIRNPNANVTMAAKRFSTPHRIIVSGSPIQNNLQELWSLFDFVSPGRLGTLPVFLEEFGHPIEAGNLAGANEVKVAAASQCAMALRELTQPLILRRTKAECMDVLKLPHKSEQVLFCNLTHEQYQVYVHFLQTEQVRRAKSVTVDRKAVGAVFFAISVLRKLCNHPDLLLLNADSEALPDDMWNFEKSGKMKVLAQIMKLWHRKKHRALIFVQTIQMLEVLQRWMTRIGYTHLRIDGTTPVKRRLAMIEEFNGNTDYFAMILTTRVGGVGLNIVGADRVVIFDPDWNPTTDAQARERTWRIGQKRDVSVYRLICTGTVEEKIYQRQVCKHFLAQKVLHDPRQRQFFKWNDLSDLFEIPPAPPDFKRSDMLALREKYRAVFEKLFSREKYGEFEVETTEIMRSISDLPTIKQNVIDKATAEEGNTILQTLFDSKGIKASFNHDKVEQTLLDRKIVRQGASMIAQRALEALKRSSRERAGHHISEPTWTGQKGSAGAAVKLKTEAKVKTEPGNNLVRRPVAGSGISSADILDGLRQLTAIRNMAQQGSISQPFNSAPSDRSPTTGQASETKMSLLPIELMKSDRLLAEAILKAFLDGKVAGKERTLTTGQVLQLLAGEVASHHADLFKSLLKQMCILNKSDHPSRPSCWTLRQEFWPKFDQVKQAKSP